MKDIFAINIGNTNTQAGVFSNGAIKDFKTRSTVSLSEDFLPDDMPIAFASVVPEAERIFNNSTKDIFRLSVEMKTGLDFSKVDASGLGADRLANAVMLACEPVLPAVCIDFGTAITFEIVDKDRCFLGGSISPGRKLQRKALSHYTSKLPFVPLQDSIDALNGDCTVNAIKLGVDAGSLGMVKELMDRIKNAFPGENLRFLATGGDAKFFSNNIKEIEFAGFDYTLKGIAKARELNRN
jgi:type III pantothenate kinase